MSLSIISEVSIILLHDVLFQFIFLSLGQPFWQWQQEHLSFETGYLSLYIFMAWLTFEAAIILILKHAALLCLSGSSPELALMEAELNFKKANIALKIQEHFNASYQEYTMEQFITFLIDTNFGLLKFTFTKIIADVDFRGT